MSGAHLLADQLEACIDILIMSVHCYIIFQALTTRDFLNVKQDNPYGDISIVETSKLKESLEADNMA